MAFIKVKCEKCKNEQVINDKAAMTVNCLICGNTLATPRGGKAIVSAIIIE